MRVSLTRRGDYAVRAALAIALLDGERPVSARRIAERMNVPARFLPHVLADLVRAGLVVGTQGRAGGYRLSRPAAEIDLLCVVDAVEGAGDDGRCVLRGGPCRLDGTCAVHEPMAAATAALRAELRRASLSQLVADGLPGVRLGLG